jgi:hypothetical protein
MLGGVSLSFNGIAGCFEMVNGPLMVAPKSGFLSAPVPGIPTKVYVQAEKVREPLADFSFVDSRCCTALQDSKWIKVNRLCAMGPQIGIQERGVTQLIVRIVGDILRHVAIEISQRRYVRRISRVGSPVVRCGRPTEFIVLGPKIALHDFGP